MTYVDSYVLPVPKRKRAAYTKMARIGRKVWMDHGALAYYENIADDAPAGKRTSFPRAVKLKKTEDVWVSFVVYKSRKHRDKVNAAVMKDKRLTEMKLPDGMPFDGKRLIFGGFKTIVGS